MLRSTMNVTMPSGCRSMRIRCASAPSSSSGAFVYRSSRSLIEAPCWSLVARTGRWFDRSADAVSSGGREEGQRAVGQRAGGHEPSEEFGQAGEVLVGQSVIQPGQVLVANPLGDARCLGGLCGK